MLSYKALILSVILALFLAVLTIGLARLDSIIQYFGIKSKTQLATLVDLAVCGLSLSSYSIVGAFYAYLDPRSHQRAITTGITAGILAGGTFIFEVMLSAMISLKIESINPITDFQRGLEADPPLLGDTQIIVYLGILLGLAIALASIFFLGAVAAFLFANFMGQRRR